MPLSPPTSSVNPAGADLMAAGLNMLEWNYYIGLATTSSAPASQEMYAVVVPVVAGTVYTGVKLVVNTAASGAAPTGFFVGLASYAILASTGVMVAQSDNLGGSAALTVAGAAALPFNASYTETATGVRVLLFFQNGAFGATNPTFSRSGNSGNALGTTTGLSWNYATAGTVITAFQANGAALANAYTFSATPQHWFAALY